MQKILIAGPWLGEFGWELFMWQARIRYLHFNEQHDKTVCVCRTGHEYLYNDFASEIIFLDLPGEKNGWRLNEQNVSLPFETVRYLTEKYGDISPSQLLQPGCSFDYKDQKFISFACKDNGQKSYDLIFHCRSTSKLNTAYRNWETEKWEKLRDNFSGLKIACVGSKEESISIEGADDLRGISLKALAGTLSNSKMIIGPSSGTMHFASLCGCKHIVFTDDKRNFGQQTNRYRYETGWNPLNTKAIVIDGEGWKPSVETVVRHIERELA